MARKLLFNRVKENNSITKIMGASSAVFGSDSSKPEQPLWMTQLLVDLSGIFNNEGTRLVVKDRLGGVDESEIPVLLDDVMLQRAP